MPPDASPAAFFDRRVHQSQQIGGQSSLPDTRSELCPPIFRPACRRSCFSGGGSQQAQVVLRMPVSTESPFGMPGSSSPNEPGFLTERPPAWASPGAIWERGNASVTVASATTAIAAATAIAATTAGTRLAGPRFVHGQSPPVVILIVKTANRLLRLGIGVHLDKTEALAASRVTVGDDLSTLDRSELREELLKIRTADLVGQVPDVQFLTHHQSPERNQRRPTVAFPGREERDRVKTQRAEGRQRRREKIPERIDIANSTRSQPIMNYTTQPTGR